MLSVSFSLLTVPCNLFPMPFSQIGFGFIMERTIERTFPPLSKSQRQLLQEGIQCFNGEQFFECHEVLETAWLDALGDQKTFLQGLIQMAVAFHHLRRGNLVGARRLLTAGIDKLSSFAPQQEAVDVGGLLRNLEPLRQQINAGEVPTDWPAPQILWKGNSEEGTCGRESETGNREQ